MNSVNNTAFLLSINYEYLNARTESNQMKVFPKELQAICKLSLKVKEATTNSQRVVHREDPFPRFVLGSIIWLAGAGMASVFVLGAAGIIAGFPLMGAGIPLLMGALLTDCAALNILFNSKGEANNFLPFIITSITVIALIVGGIVGGIFGGLYACYTKHQTEKAIQTIENNPSNITTVLDHVKNNINKDSKHLQKLIEAVQTIQFDSQIKQEIR